MKNLYRKIGISLFVFAVGSCSLLAQTEQQKVAIQQKSNVSELNVISAKLAMLSQTEKALAKQMAIEKGWKINGFAEDGAYYELMRIAEDGSPIYYQTYNRDAGISTRAHTLHSNGLLNLNLNGEGMYVSVWDGGHARISHQEYDGIGGNNRVQSGDYSTSLNAHSGHVMGTILASGFKSQAKGMAPRAKGYSYDWTSDSSEATNAAANGMILSNHSYGFLAANLPYQYFGAYIDESRTWDQIMYNAPYYLMVVAAGNDGNADNYNSYPLDDNPAYDKLTGHAVSKNNLVVANLKDAEIDAQGNLIAVTRNPSSSEGPTDDYRIKPDISGNGTDVYSSTTSSDYAYQYMTGTSMAAPNVTGTLLLLQQHHSNLNGSLMKAATLKGLALHTADDVEDFGPDAETGWGLLNAKAAAQAISQEGNQSIIKELTLTQGQTYTTTVEAAGNQDLKVSISWTDPAGQAVSQANSHTPVLVNDLDLVVKKYSTSYYPWKLTSVTSNTRGDNDVDPFERVDINNANGQYTITVSHEGSLYSGEQKYSLIITGIGEGSSDDSIAPSTPSGLSASATTTTSTQLSWNSSTDNVAVVGYEIYKDGTLHETVSTNSATISGLTPNTNYSFKVKAYDAAGNRSSFSNTAYVTTDEDVQDLYCTSQGQSVNDEYIQKVVLNTINNSSTGGNGYSDFTDVSTDLEKNGSYTISVTPKWTGSQYNEGYGVWIDFNRDNDFNDAGEQVFSKSPSKVSPVSGTFTVPSSATTGSTRMRVVMKYNATPNTACETSFDYGEVEDYTVNLVAGNAGDTEKPSKPANVTVTATSTSSISLDWSNSTDNVGVEFYNIYQDGSVVKTSTTSNATITGLSDATTYAFQITAVDAAGNESYKSNTVTATTDEDVVAPPTDGYCTSKGQSVNDEYIQNVELNTIDNASNGGNGYSDFTSISTDLAKDEAHTIIITPKWPGSQYNEGYGVWIDYNGDGDFADAGEKVFSKAPSKASPVSGSFTVPSTATTGATRMRVVMKYNATPSACETSFDYGEVEDYTVNIVSAGSDDIQRPTQPANVNVTATTASSVSLSWLSSSDNVGVVAYNVYQDGNVVKTSTSTSTTVSGLSSDTTYAFQISAVDAAQNESVLSYAVNATTQEDIIAPTPNDYCSSQGDSVADEYIQKVVLNTINNSSNGGNGYADFTSISTDLGKNTTHTITITPKWTGSQYNEGYGVWIDYNGDGDFSDAGEKVFSKAPSKVSPVSGSFTIPNAASIGTTRMRVVMKYNATPTACETSFDYGEVEDYTVNITNLGSNANNAVVIENPNIEAIDMVVYPNPVKTGVVNIKTEQIKDGSYEILDMSGKLIKFGTFSGGSLQINVEGVSAGKYFVRISKDGQRAVKGFLIQ